MCTVGLAIGLIALGLGMFALASAIYAMGIIRAVTKSEINLEAEALHRAVVDRVVSPPRPEPSRPLKKQ